LVIGRIDADDAEVHGPRIDAVDARPRFAAVAGLVDAAALEAVGSLLLLDVLLLAAVETLERPARVARRRTVPLAQRQLHVLALRCAGTFQLQLVAGVVVLHFRNQLTEGKDRLVADADNDVARLQPRLVGRPALGDLRHAGAGVGVFALDAEETVAA